MRVFGTLEIFIYGGWSDYLLPISESWSLTFLPSHVYKLVGGLNLLRDVSLI